MEIQKINHETASEAVMRSFEKVKVKLGRVPNMYQVMANSCAVLDAYIGLNTTLASGLLSKEMAESIALATAEYNNCSYCLSAHTFFGQKVGLSEDEMLQARTFSSEKVQRNIALGFVNKLLQNPKSLTHHDVIPLREAGFSDGEILEIVTHVVRNMWTNYVNTISHTEVDWPVVIEPLNLVSNEI